MLKMTSRERVSMALEHKEPDMVPIDFGGAQTSLHPIAHRNLKEFLRFKIGKEIIQDMICQVSTPDKKILDLFKVDVVSIFAKSPSFWELKIDPIKDEWINEWGTKLIRPKNGFFYDIKKPVMKDFTIEDLKKYKLPDPADASRFKGLRREVLDLYNNTNKALITFSGAWGILENLWLCRGFEQAYIDIAEKKFAALFFDKLLWWQKTFFDKSLSEIGDLVNIVAISDDLGSQQGPIINPETYRSLLKPRHKELVEFIKTKTKAKIYIHSCGSLDWVIKDFIEIGIEIINPVQVSAYGMDTKKLKKEFGDYISFWGGGCDNDILLKGTPKEVEKEVKKRIEELAPGGGFVFAPIHHIQANTPPENIIAMFNSAIKYRKY